jgi:cephalosporin-C deacetylase-like acetyl esterase
LRGPALPPIGVTADHPDWNYTPNQPVTFTVTAKPGTAITYTIGPEMMRAPSQTATIPETGALAINGGTLDHPGFLRCIVTATGYGRNLATAAFSPEKIQPTQREPADFDAFWDKAKAELAKLPIDPQLTPLPQLNTANADAFEVSLQNIGTPPAATSRFYGLLYIPHGDGPFPAMMSPPGAGVRGPDRDLWNWTDPTRNFIVLYVGIHEIPMAPLPTEPGAATVPGNYPNVGLDDPAHYYFRRVLMGCVRADDYLVSLPKWDHKNLVAYGGSQGGYLSITTAALDPRVTALCPSYPAYCDETGYLHDRPAGWPAMKFADTADPQRDAKIATTAYFDGVNFAKRIKAPGHYAWGYNDETCPPDSTFSAYNQITAPKELTIIKEMGHGRIPALTDREHDWVMKHLAPAGR